MPTRKAATSRRAVTPRARKAATPVPRAPKRKTDPLDTFLQRYIPTKKGGKIRKLMPKRRNTTQKA